MSPAAGSSIFGSFWAERKIRFSGVWSARSRARIELSRPTTKGAIMCGKTTMSRSGTSGSSSRVSVIFLAGFPEDRDRFGAILDRLLGDHALFDLFVGGHLIHHLEHQLFDDHLQAAGSDVSQERLLGDRLEGVVGELQVDVFELEHRLVLLDERVLGFLEDLDERSAVELRQCGDHGKPADELRNHAVLDQVLRVDLLEQGAGTLLTLGLDLRAEAHRLFRLAPGNDLLEAHERAPADEQDVGRVDLDELLVRVLAPALRRDVGDGALEDLQKRLLNAFAGNVSSDRGVLALPGDLVRLVDVDDAPLGLLLVGARDLVELQDDVLDILADVPGLGESRRVDDRERDREHLCQRLGEQRLAHSRRADQEDVGLLKLDVELAVLLEVVDPLVVVVDGDGELLLRLLLPDYVGVEELLDLLRLRELRLGRRSLEDAVLGDDVEADVDALVANVDGGPGDELLDVSLALVAKGTAQDIAVAGFLGHLPSGGRNGSNFTRHNPTISSWYGERCFGPGHSSPFGNQRILTPPPSARFRRGA